MWKVTIKRNLVLRDIVKHVHGKHFLVIFHHWRCHQHHTVDHLRFDVEAER